MSIHTMWISDAHDHGPERGSVWPADASLHSHKPPTPTETEVGS